MFLLYQRNQRTKSTNKKKQEALYIRIKNQSRNNSILNVGSQKKLTHSSIIIS